MTTKNLCHKGSLRHPYHYYLTWDGLNLDLYSQESCSDLHVGTLVNERKRRGGLVIKKHPHRHIPKIRRNLSLKALTQNQKQHPSQKRHTVLQLIKSNQCSRQIKGCSFWEMSQKQGKRIQQLKEREIQLQEKPNKVVSFGQELVLRASEAFFSFYRSSS